MNIQQKLQSFSFHDLLKEKDCIMYLANVESYNVLNTRMVSF
jgi:hypothetical protein